VTAILHHANSNIDSGTIIRKAKGAISVYTVRKAYGEGPPQRQNWMREAAHP